MRASRLGDDIDDFCVKCKRLTNHSVVSLLGDDPAKVRCRSCHSDHDFRHEQPPPPKIDPRKAALAAAAATAPAILDAEIPAEVEPDVEEVVEAPPAPKAKAKKKAKA